MAGRDAALAAAPAAGERAAVTGLHRTSRERPKPRGRRGETAVLRRPREPARAAKVAGH